MTDTTRDLIQRMATELDLYRQMARDDCTSTHPFADEARAYLAQPEREGPTDEPLGDLIDKWVQEAFRKKPYGCKHPTHTYVACKAFEHGRNHAARTALSQPEPEGLTEEELETDFLCWYKDRYSTAYFGAVPLAVLIAWTQFDRARLGRPAVEPVTVSERPWEREGWCDSNGWCWGFDADDTDPFWDFDRPEAWFCWTHVLPHYALPIPAPTEKS